MADYLAIDIGGTYIKYAFMNSEKKLYGHNKLPTEENVDHALIKQVEGIIQSALEAVPISGVGISTAGIVDRDKGEIIYAGPTIKNYKGTAWKEQLSQKFHLPIHVENDVNAALLGERWQGSAKGMNHVYCITLGTGIGGAYFHDDLADGVHHQANSIGYLLYNADTDTNFENRASTSALNKMIQQEYGENVSAKTIFDWAKNGDHTSNVLIENWTREIARGLAQIILVVDPQCIIIGGGISAQGRYLLDLIERQIPSFLPNHFYKTEIKVAQLFNDAALYGAVYPFNKEEK
ncbi:ROK family protein [Bacillus sp. FJAT-27251]|uniref:ROK family protein n=1 Tax=Bacillus sp. FJAT-27251 TaxID=1684142 RepID=UPI0006A783A3|nr:ROK family protein [Bacillus sp. FJAT-27251]